MTGLNIGLRDFPSHAILEILNTGRQAGGELGTVLNFSF